MDNGQNFPNRKNFENTEYDPATRTFTGDYTFEPDTVNGNQFWNFRLVFSPDFSMIESGYREAWTPQRTKTTK